MTEYIGDSLLTTVVIYSLAAVIPAVFLMRYIYRQDTIEKEPWSVLWRLILAGVLSGFLAMVLEALSEVVIFNHMDYDPYLYPILDALSVGIIEEGCKMFFLYRRTFHNPTFNFRYDGIVYAVFVSLGFALLENILYVFMYGLSVAAMRALLAVPAHMGFAVYMGTFFGQAKVAHVQGKPRKRNGLLVLAYIVPVLLHTFYDGTIMVGTDEAMVLFVAFVIGMYIFVIRKVKKESRLDVSIF